MANQRARWKQTTASEASVGETTRSTHDVRADRTPAIWLALRLHLRSSEVTAWHACTESEHNRERRPHTHGVRTTANETHAPLQPPPPRGTHDLSPLPLSSHLLPHRDLHKVSEGRSRGASLFESISGTKRHQRVKHGSTDIRSTQRMAYGVRAQCLAARPAGMHALRFMKTCVAAKECSASPAQLPRLAAAAWEASDGFSNADHYQCINMELAQLGKGCCKVIIRPYTCRRQDRPTIRFNSFINAVGMSSCLRVASAVQSSPPRSDYDPRGAILGGRREVAKPK
ncbi:hypothetical protein BV20DRAFT_967414 [Pilatotrama ljubarskyi]|nr:hypothetical protein BV20DRAFT_967414 [Pilatotrama ljubarskyi]